MTHILTNPGYPNSLRFRSKSVDVLREHEKLKEGLPKTEFDKIRSLSRQSWKDTWQDPGNPLPRVKSNHFVTTYSTTHNYRALRELTPCRPTSPTRRNNPHPTRSVVLLFVETSMSIYRQQVDHAELLPHAYKWQHYMVLRVCKYSVLQGFLKLVLVQNVHISLFKIFISSSGTPGSLLFGGSQLCRSAEAHLNVTPGEKGQDGLG